MFRTVVGFALALGIGAGCGIWEIPVPMPQRLGGAMIVVAMTLGYIVTDHCLPKAGMSKTGATKSSVSAYVAVREDAVTVKAESQAPVR